MDFNTDKNISQEDICAGISRLKAVDLQIGLEVDCPDTEDEEFNIYGTLVADVEICD